jgi:hypothetical protein
VTRFVVECRRDPLRGSVPERFGWDARLRRVAEILDAWEGEDHRYFRVRADDGAVFILRHDRASDRWRVHYFEGAPSAGR